MKKKGRIALNMNEITARRLAFHALLKCYNDKKYSNLELDSIIKQNPLEARDRALLTALVYGVIEKRITLDYIISHFSTRTIENITPPVMTILEMGIYQILYFDRVPDRAACNESVEIIKKVSGIGASSFVNGILREIIRQRDNIENIYESLDKISKLSVKSALPEWIINLWIESYGEQKALELINTVNKQSHITLLCNTLKITREEFYDKLKKAEINCEIAEDSQRGIFINQPIVIDAIPGSREGLFIVQDLSSQIAIEMLCPKEGDFVIDCCSCPGGKSFAAAVMMNNKGRILSLDLHRNKLSLVESGAQKLGISVIETRKHDGSQPMEEFIGMADAVICDVPCSGLGVISKKPDIRHKKPSEIEKLPTTQYNILNSAAKYLKPGGKLLYSTCTLNPCENDEITSRFLLENPEFKRAYGKEKGLTLFPELNGNVCRNDGFFIDILERI